MFSFTLFKAQYGYCLVGSSHSYHCSVLLYSWLCMGTVRLVIHIPASALFYFIHGSVRVLFCW